MNERPRAVLPPIYPNDSWDRNSDVGRYWGLWVERIDSDGEIKTGWMTRTDGYFYYFPHPGIAQAQAAQINKDRGCPREWRCSAREFRYNEWVEPHSGRYFG